MTAKDLLATMTDRRDADCWHWIATLTTGVDCAHWLTADLLDQERPQMTPLPPR